MFKFPCWSVNCCNTLSNRPPIVTACLQEAHLLEVLQQLQCCRIRGCHTC
jgi:hypothetical protein